MLEGKNIIVTGAAGSIGLAMVKEFLKQGAHVFACAHQPKDPDELGNLLQAFPEKLFVSYFDMTDYDAMKKALMGICKQAGNIDGLVNNSAKISNNQMFVMDAMDDIKDVFEINFFSQVKITQIIARKMMSNKHKRASIVNMVSLSAIEGLGMTGYCCSKAALICLTSKLAKELAPFNIRTNAIAPGLVQSPMLNKIPQDFQNLVLQCGVSKQVAKPEGIASVAGFLLSDLSQQINGQIIRADA